MKGIHRRIESYDDSNLYRNVFKLKRENYFGNELDIPWDISVSLLLLSLAGRRRCLALT